MHLQTQQPLIHVTSSSIVLTAIESDEVMMRMHPDKRCRVNEDGRAGIDYIRWPTTIKRKNTSVVQCSVIEMNISSVASWSIHSHPIRAWSNTIITQSNLNGEVILLWMEKILWLDKTVLRGDAELWTNVGFCRLGAVNPTKKVIHHGSDCTPASSTAPAQNPCGPYWLAVGVHSRVMVNTPACPRHC